MFGDYQCESAKVMFAKLKGTCSQYQNSLAVGEGESFYNPYIPGVIEELTHKGLVKESAGARAIFIEGYCVPLIVVKRDGGYNYASTDLVSLCLNEEKADWIIYVTDSSQEQHFTMIFKVCPCFYGQTCRLAPVCS
ncbi:unnamed protein product [Cuscuta epithymum]|uniref:Arginyl-tRNA synthetase catalytic core domain-containing protein n=1 Tax=Cuscuta epithymum TaxID=186058 RepID=A0AAV0ERC4_9ASTE|nr:unnamed protein product [Cuscuta epithymum]